MRSSGILLPVSSLPSPYGIGSIGSATFAFVDFLQAAGQQYWQVLPLGPTGYGDSPYQSFSAFAGNPYFIDLPQLAAEGLLTEAELASARDLRDPQRVDYGALFERRFAILAAAVDRVDPEMPELADFFAENADWLEDYALFMAIKEERGQQSLQRWPRGLRMREERAMQAARRRLQKRVWFWKTVQFFFYSQWKRLKSYANQKGIRIIGDLPIYVSPDSADLWANSAMFQLDERRRPTEVAGVPPDAFSADGQLWGNPLYDWKKHRAQGYAWWLQRLRQAANLCDLVRIDHFRGFESYYAIPAGAKTAAKGRWRKGPGMELIRAIRKELPDLGIIAEDLGLLTPAVRRLLAESGLPGMKVLQFAFDPRGNSDYLPHNYPRNTVVYTGTHDNTTTEDWQYTAPLAEVSFARQYLGVKQASEFTDAMIRAAFSSVAELCIIPMQDHLHLGAPARINTPSTLGNNWVWRLAEGQLTPQLAQRIRRLTATYGRLPQRSRGRGGKKRAQ